MKKLYLYSVLLYTCFIGYSQQNLQNANWHFGSHAAINYLPNPSTPVGVSGSAIVSSESCASVSNQAGELLFYTDGVTVWNKYHQVMPNGTGLLGDESNTQIAIIPRPKYPNNYYIITISGSTAGQKGLYSTEVDMSIGNGEVISAKKNIVFKDHNSTPVSIDPNYNNRSEKVTSAPHSNGGDYWMIAQINNNIYSYLITSSGPVQTPSSTTPSLIDFTQAQNPGIGQMKISPDTQNIGICYAVPPTVYLGTFNNTTGLVTLDSTPITVSGSNSFYGLEFSPSSQYVYFTGSMLYHSDGTALRGVSGGTEEEKGILYRTNISDRSTELIAEFPTTSEEIMQTMTTDPIPGASYYCSLQLAINGKIYMAKNSASIGVINAPDNYLNPNVQANNNAIPLLAGSVCKLGLPQWVHWQTKNCEDNIVLTVPDTHMSPYTYEYTNFVTAQAYYKVNATQEITLKAGNYILLNPDTVIDTGSLFVAQIGECTGIANMTSFEARNINTNEPEEATVNGFIVYPNPTNGLLTVKSPLTQTKTSTFVITDITGKELMRVNNQGQNETQLDLSALSAGIYFLSADGIPVQKIIKN